MGISPQQPNVDMKNFAADAPTESYIEKNIKLCKIIVFLHCPGHLMKNFT